MKPEETRKYSHTSTLIGCQEIFRVFQRDPLTSICFEIFWKWNRARKPIAQAIKPYKKLFWTLKAPFEVKNSNFVNDAFAISQSPVREANKRQDFGIVT